MMILKIKEWQFALCIFIIRRDICPVRGSLKMSKELNPVHVAMR